MGLYISYWRCHFTRTIRIMREEDHVPVGTMKLKGKALTKADQRRAEKLKEQLESTGGAAAPGCKAE